MKGSLLCARRNECGGGQSGVSILELSIVLPVVMLLIAGIVDFGVKINSVKHVSNAARHGARVAAAHSRRLNVGLPCGLVQNQFCPTAPTPANASTPVADVGYLAACSFLTSTGGQPDKWRINSYTWVTTEDGKAMQMITVEVVRDASDCLVCYERLSDIFVAQSKSTFILEGECV